MCVCGFFNPLELEGENLQKDLMQEFILEHLFQKRTPN
jgi:hypothetical protein